MNRLFHLSFFWSLVFVATTQGELLLHATFDEDTIDGDTVRDVSGNGFNGEILGEPESVTGVAGNAFEFFASDEDGIDFDIDEMLDAGTEDFSVSVWFDADPDGNAEFVVSKGNPTSRVPGWSIWMERTNVHVRGQQLDASNDDRFGMFEPNVDAGLHHVVLVLDRQEDVIRGYLDGQLMSSAGGGGSQTDQLIPNSEIFSDSPMLVGRRATDGAPLSGFVDDLQIYTQALTAEDAAFLFANPGMTIAGAANPFDYNGDGVLDIGDLDLLSAEVKAGTNNASFDVNGDGAVDSTDIAHYVEGPDTLNTWVGDANLDSEFNSGDLVSLFSAGQFEDGIAMNSTWASGDFNGDGEFDSGDFVAAFAGGGFEQGPRAAAAAVPEPTCFSLVLLPLLLLFRVRPACFVDSET